jgi:hypothetical protein
VLGLDVLGSENKIVWTLTRTDRHGIERMTLGLDNLVTLIAEARSEPDATVKIDVSCDKEFWLEVRRPSKDPFVVKIDPGSSELTVP